MTSTELALPCWRCWLTPGPTNTLLFLSGAETSSARRLRLLVVLAAYLATVVPLALVG